MSASINIHATANDNTSDNISANTKINTAIFVYANDDDSANENVNTILNNCAKDYFLSEIIDITSASLRLHP